MDSKRTGEQQQFKNLVEAREYFMRELSKVAQLPREILFPRRDGIVTNTDGSLNFHRTAQNWQQRHRDEQAASVVWVNMMLDKKQSTGDDNDR
jgi:hypothetical protein